MIDQNTFDLDIKPTTAFINLMNTTKWIIEENF